MGAGATRSLPHLARPTPPSPAPAAPPALNPQGGRRGHKPDRLDPAHRLRHGQRGEGWVGGLVGGWLKWRVGSSSRALKLPPPQDPGLAWPRCATRRREPRGAGAGRRVRCGAHGGWAGRRLGAGPSKAAQLCLIAGDRARARLSLHCYAMLPQVGFVESFNISVAAALIMWVGRPSAVRCGMAVRPQLRPGCVGLPSAACLHLPQPSLGPHPRATAPRRYEARRHREQALG